MVKIDIKPLSVNDAWKGRRYKTDDYKRFEKQVLILLPKEMYIPEGDLVLHLEWGFSSAASDYDNPIKPFQDCLEKKYGFNDNRIKRGTQEKFKVNKGEEYIRFKIEEYKQKTKEL